MSLNEAAFAKAVASYFPQFATFFVGMAVAKLVSQSWCRTICHFESLTFALEGWP
jgi:hypothetical protein